MERKIYVAACEHGSIISTKTTRVGFETLVQTEVASACMLHAILARARVLNPDIAKKLCPVERNGDAFGKCKAKIEYTAK